MCTVYISVRFGLDVYPGKDKNFFAMRLKPYGRSDIYVVVFFSIKGKFDKHVGDRPVSNYLKAFC